MSVRNGTTKTSSYPRVVEDRILVRPDPINDRSAGGILLPESAKDKPKRGYVLGIGPGKFLNTGERSKFIVMPGDRILFGAHSGVEVEHNGETLLVMQEADILTIGE